MNKQNLPALLVWIGVWKKRDIGIETHNSTILAVLVFPGGDGLCKRFTA